MLVNPTHFTSKLFKVNSPVRRKVKAVGVWRSSFAKTLQAVRGRWSFLRLSAGSVTTKLVRQFIRRMSRQIADRVVGQQFLFGVPVRGRLRISLQWNQP